MSNKLLTKKMILETSQERLRELVVTPAIQRQVVDFHDKKLKPIVATREGYLQFLLQAQKEKPQFTPNLVRRGVDLMLPLAEEADIGHDAGHFFREFSGGFYIRWASLKAGFAAFSVEIDAAFWAIGGHDIFGLKACHRYSDKKTPADHGMTGALVAYLLFEGMMPESMRLLIAIGIAGHPHVVEHKVEEPFVYHRVAINDEIYRLNGKLFNVTQWLVRGSDRADLTGDTLIPRDLGSKADVVADRSADQVDIVGGGKSIMAITPETLINRLRYDFDPEVANTGAGFGGGASILEHFWALAKSQDGSTKYSENDHLFPPIQRLIAFRRKQAEATLKDWEEMKDYPESSYTDERLRVVMYAIMRQNAAYPAHFPRIQDVLWNAMMQQPKSDRVKWLGFFHKLHLRYADSIAFYRQLIDEVVPKGFREIAHEILDGCV